MERTAAHIHAGASAVVTAFQAALVALNLVSGSTSEYGLMVDTVNGITLDYNKDGMYWSFYINGEYAMTGVDATPVEADATYSFVATAA